MIKTFQKKENEDKDILMHPYDVLVNLLRRYVCILNFKLGGKIRFLWLYDLTIGGDQSAHIFYKMILIFCIPYGYKLSRNVFLCFFFLVLSAKLSSEKFTNHCLTTKISSAIFANFTFPLSTLFCDFKPGKKLFNLKH